MSLKTEKTTIKTLKSENSLTKLVDLQIHKKKTLGQGNQVITVTVIVFESFVFRMFSAHAKTQSGVFKIPPV